MVSSSQPNDAHQQQTDDLLATHKLLRATLDSSIDMIQVFEAVRNQQGQIIDFTWILNNHAAQTIYGDVVGKRLLQCQPGVVEEGIFEAFTHVVETGQPQQYEKQYVHEQFDGWFHQSVVKLNDGVATTTADITNRKKAEEQLQQSQAFFQSVMDSSLDSIQVFKAVRGETGSILDFVWVMNNQKAVAQNGQVIGESLLKQNPGVFPTGIFDHMVEVIQTGIAYEQEQYYEHEQFTGWFYQALVKTDDSVTMTTRAISRQKQDEQEILRLNGEVAQKATDKYRALFDSIDEGFAIVEVFPDQRGQVTDMIWREANPGVERHTGMGGWVGKRASELVPNLEPDWLNAITGVYQTGEPVRMEAYNTDLARWIDTYYARVGGPGSLFVAAVFQDITERKRLEQAQRENEERQVFLLDLSDAIRAQPDVNAIGEFCTCRLAEHLQLDRCYLATLFPEEDRVLVGPEYRRPDLKPASGEYRLSDFPEVVRYTQTQTGVFNDVAGDSHLTESDKMGLAAIDIGAFINVSVRKGTEKVLWAVIVTSTTPRVWTPGEIDLLEEVAERIWSAIERAKAEETLRESQSRLSAVFAALPVGVGFTDTKGSLVLANQLMQRYMPTGILPSRDNDRVSRWQSFQPDGSPLERDEFPGARALRGEQVMPGIDMRYTQDDGTQIWTRVTAVPILGDAGQITGQVSVVTDIDALKRASTALRQKEQTQSFLLKLSDALRPLSDSAQLERTAMRVLGQELGVDRAFFATIDADGESWSIRHDYTNGVASYVGRHPMSSFQRSRLPQWQAGRLSSITDSETDAGLTAADRAAYAALGTRAAIGVPLVKEGRFAALLSVNQTMPRVWTEAELALTSEAAERTWVAIERARALEALRKSDERFRTLVQNLPDYAIFRIDPQGTITEWTEGAQRVKGYTAQEAIGQSIALFYTPEGLAAGELTTELEEASQAGRAERESVRIRKADGRPEGERFWVDEIMTAIRDEQGRLVGFTKISRDITKRKKDDEALFDSRQRLQIVLDSITDHAIITTDPQSRIVSWNPGARQMFGYTAEEAIGQSTAIIFTPEDRAAGQVEQEMEQARGQGLALDGRYHLRKDGSRLYVSGSQAPLYDAGKTLLGYVKVARDLSERRRMEQALREADRRKDEFLAMLAHELRNPMSTLRSGLQILTLTAGEDALMSPTVAATTVAMMSRQTDHLVRLVDDLLDVSRISQGKIELKTARLDLVELVKQAAESVRTFYQEQGRTLQINLPTTPIYVAGDATRLTQVVTNLLTNGVRYTGEQGQVWLSLAHHRQEALLAVRDNGLGLAPDQLSAIFELFVQVDTSLARSKGGLGVGLTLVKRLVEMHGGRVEARSEGLGKGSTFRVHLPTQETAPEAAIMPAEGATNQTISGRILVIDDNADAALTLSMLLKTKGYEAHTRTSGRAGIEAAERLQPAAIVLDLGMPDLDGYETCRLIRQQPWGGTVVVIALSGYGQQEDRQRTQAAGFDGHLVKPVDLDALIKLLTALLDKGD